MTEGADDDGEFQADADEVYAELVVRIGEANPQPRLEPTRRVCELLGDVHRRSVRAYASVLFGDTPDDTAALAVFDTPAQRATAC